MKPLERRTLDLDSLRNYVRKKDGFASSPGENCNSSCIISYKMSSKYKATTPAARDFFLSEDRESE